jgi:hypothetical protein
MIDRLAALETETEKDAVYLQLLDPSASSEWDIGWLVDAGYFDEGARKRKDTDNFLLSR